MTFSNMTIGWRTLASAAALLAIGVVLGGLLAGIGRADDHEEPGSSEVRVLTERLEDGRVAVGVQQRSLAGEWERIYTPRLRAVPLDLEPGRVLRSSPIQLEIDDGRGAARIAFETRLMQSGQIIGTALAQGGSEPVLCANYDARDENRNLFCDGLEEAYEGEVSRVHGDDPDQFAADLAAAISAGAADGGIAASSYPAVSIAGTEAGKAGLRARILYSGTLIAPIPPDPLNRYCMIHHGLDPFWRVAREAADRSSSYAGIDLVIYAIDDTEDHVRAIRQCITDDAVAISTTLGAPEGVREALEEAIAAGIRVVSFNSGAGAAAELGSAVHIAVDEAAIGLKAAEAFNDRGLTGTLICIVHERENISLRERCDAAEAAYEGGEVEQFPLYEYEDWGSDAVPVLAERLRAGDVGAMLTLGAVASPTAVFAARAAESDVPIGAVGFDGDVYEGALRGLIEFVIWDQPALQAFLSVSSMLLADSLYVDPATWFGGAVVRIEPRVFERADLVEFTNELVAPGR